MTCHAALRILPVALLATLSCASASAPERAAPETAPSERVPAETPESAAAEPADVIPRIPGTTIEDTAEHREVLELCERYRRALEEKDTATLLSLASARYHDDSGTADTSDDIDAAGLEAMLDRLFVGVQDVRYEITYSTITRSGDEVQVDLNYAGRFTLDASGGGRVLMHSDSNRLVLERTEVGLRILSGM